MVSDFGLCLYIINLEVFCFVFVSWFGLVVWR